MKATLKLKSFDLFIKENRMIETEEIEEQYVFPITFLNGVDGVVFIDEIEDEENYIIEDHDDISKLMTKVL